MLTFAAGTFSNQTSATVGGVSSTGVQLGDRVAVIDWDGVNAGSTHVVWANVTAVTYHEGIPSLQVDVNVHFGSSGGGVFFNGVHIANNWQTSLNDVYSWGAINQ